MLVVINYIGYLYDRSYMEYNYYRLLLMRGDRSIRFKTGPNKHFEELPLNLFGVHKTMNLSYYIL